MYLSGFVKQGALGKFVHRREPASLDKQDVVRTNRDTLYSNGVFDLDAGPVTIVLPDSGNRYMALLIVNEDAYSPSVKYAPGRYTCTKDEMGTRYIAALIRTLVDPNDPQDMDSVHRAVRWMPEDHPNCLPIMPGWNYLARMYRPRKEVVDGTWRFPEAQPVH
jgi:hypothetical protein